jgi:pyruvate/2-oxoglutarate dehydrogenase complex dihydrolipoamide acyltransferase (E2) component
MAANKPTAVHFSLIFFVMATIVACVVMYMSIDDARELRAQLESDRKEKELQKTAALKYTTQVNLLKTKIGHEFPVGEADPLQPNTVLYAMTEDIKNYSLTTPQDYKTALREVREALQVARDNLAQEQATTKQLNDTIATLKVDYDKKVQDYDGERSAAVQARLTSENEHKQALQVERDQYAKLNGEHQKIKVQMQEAKNSHDQAIAEKEDRITRLVAINDKLQDRIETATQTTFERPDGLVHWVDNGSHLVWINLGSADNLTKQTNFSVYRKSNRGVGRDSQITHPHPGAAQGGSQNS